MGGYSAIDLRLDALIDAVDLDGLARLIDDRCSDHDGEGLVRAHATGTGAACATEPADVDDGDLTPRPMGYGPGIRC